VAIAVGDGEFRWQDMVPTYDAGAYTLDITSFTTDLLG
jgi:hypothetical protein